MLQLLGLQNERSEPIVVLKHRDYMYLGLQNERSEPVPKALALWNIELVV
jgi:hypothetical protein